MSKTQARGDGLISVIQNKCAGWTCRIVYGFPCQISTTFNQSSKMTNTGQPRLSPILFKKLVLSDFQSLFSGLGL